MHCTLCLSSFITEQLDFDEVNTIITLTPTHPESCVSVEVIDDSDIEDFEYLTVSLSITGQRIVELSHETTLVFIADNDRT